MLIRWKRKIEEEEAERVINHHNGPITNHPLTRSFEYLWIRIKPFLHFSISFSFLSKLLDNDLSVGILTVN